MPTFTAEIEGEEIELEYSYKSLEEAAALYCITYINHEGIDALIAEINNDNDESVSNLVHSLLGNTNDFFYQILINREQVIKMAEQKAIDEFNEDKYPE